MTRHATAPQLILLSMLLVPAMALVGCEEMFRVRVDGDERGARIAVDGRDVRLRASGGPRGGRFSLDTPQASIHLDGRNNGRYRSRPPRYFSKPILGRGPFAPADSADRQDASTALLEDGSSSQDRGPLPPEGAYERRDAPTYLAKAATGERRGPGAPSSDGRSLLDGPDPISLEESANEVAMLEIINEVRRRSGLAPVRPDRRLDEVARKHSEEMLSLGYFDHTSPIDENKSLSDRFENDGVSFRRATENIAKYPYKQPASVRVAGTSELTAQTPGTLAEKMMEGYMNSPGHRANILDPQVGRVGIGTVIGRRYAYNTQNFRD